MCAFYNKLSYNITLTSIKMIKTFVVITFAFILDMVKHDKRKHQ